MSLSFPASYLFRVVNVLSSSVCVFNFIHLTVASGRFFNCLGDARVVITHIWPLPAHAGRKMAAPCGSARFQDDADGPPFIRLLLLLLLHWLRLPTLDWSKEEEDSPKVESRASFFVVIFR